MEESTTIPSEIDKPDSEKRFIFLPKSLRTDIERIIQNGIIDETTIEIKKSL